jgi:hypothetical protein
VKHFGRDRYRREGDKEVLVCAPEELYPRVAELLLSRGIFSRGYLHANELRLAAAHRIPPFCDRDGVSRNEAVQGRARAARSR